jgi:two-component system sensor histidine kinase TctE
LLIWLLAPLTIVVLASAVIGYYFALRFATLAYDRALFETARDISNQVKIVGGDIRVDLPDVTLNMIESDQWDRVYYMVSSAEGKFVTGNRGLPPLPAESPPNKPVYYDAQYLGQPVRVAALYRSTLNPASVILVQTAETLNKRRILANEILLGMLLPELILIVLVGTVVWYGIARGLRPLATLQREIGSRSSRDLSPLSETSVPDEVQPLIQSMNSLLVRLNEALSAQQRFIADAAHQLRTPLAGLRTQTELALRQNTSEDVRDTLQRLNTATTNTTHLVGQLLALARAEPGAHRSQPMQNMDLNDLAKNVTAEWVPQAIEKNIDLGFDEKSQSAYIEGDAIFLREMLSNLLDNAIRYTHKGGRVTVRVAQDVDHVVLGVEDNGPGIPEQERGRVFERFHRLLGNNTEGCGLGLAIVREIAQEHKAKIWLGNGADGIGTLITLSFSPSKIFNA